VVERLLNSDHPWVEPEVLRRAASWDNQFAVVGQTSSKVAVMAKGCFPLPMCWEVM
jgi:hypothetical protein